MNRNLAMRDARVVTVFAEWCGRDIGASSSLCVHTPMTSIAPPRMHGWTIFLEMLRMLHHASALTSAGEGGVTVVYGLR